MKFDQRLTNQLTDALTDGRISTVGSAGEFPESGARTPINPEQKPGDIEDGYELLNELIVQQNGTAPFPVSAVKAGVSPEGDNGCEGVMEHDAGLADRLVSALTPKATVQYQAGSEFPVAGDKSGVLSPENPDEEEKQSPDQGESLFPHSGDKSGTVSPE